MKLKLNIQRFASTNKTANYNLSQYVGSDKPTYLGDYNSDMNKIDTQMKANSTAISEVGTKTDLAKTTADTALNNADLAQNTADEANTTATSALQKAVTNEANINKFNLTNFESFDSSKMNITKGNILEGYFTIASDNSNSICKIYGHIMFNISNLSGENTLSFQTSLRPKEDVTINCLGFKFFTYTNNITNLYPCDVKITKEGLVSINVQVDNNVTNVRVHLEPCVIFLKSFGDTGSQTL